MKKIILISLIFTLILIGGMNATAEDIPFNWYVCDDAYFFQMDPATGLPQDIPGLATEIISLNSLYEFLGSLYNICLIDPNNCISNIQLMNTFGCVINDYSYSEGSNYYSKTIEGRPGYNPTGSEDSIWNLYHFNDSSDKFSITKFLTIMRDEDALTEAFLATIYVGHPSEARALAQAIVTAFSDPYEIENIVFVAAPPEGQPSNKFILKIDTTNNSAGTPTFFGAYYDETSPSAHLKQVNGSSPKTEMIITTVTEPQNIWGYSSVQEGTERDFPTQLFIGSPSVTELKNAFLNKYKLQVRNINSAGPKDFDFKFISRLRIGEISGNQRTTIPNAGIIAGNPDSGLKNIIFRCSNPTNYDLKKISLISSVLHANGVYGSSCMTSNRQPLYAENEMLFYNSYANLNRGFETGATGKITITGGDLVKAPGFANVYIGKDGWTAGSAKTTGTLEIDGGWVNLRGRTGDITGVLEADDFVMENGAIISGDFGTLNNPLHLVGTNQLSIDGSGIVAPKAITLETSDQANRQLAINELAIYTFSTTEENITINNHPASTANNDSEITNSSIGTQTGNITIDNSTVNGNQKQLDVTNTKIIAGFTDTMTPEAWLTGPGNYDYDGVITINACGNLTGSAVHKTKIAGHRTQYNIVNSQLNQEPPFVEIFNSLMQWEVCTGTQNQCIVNSGTCRYTTCEANEEENTAYTTDCEDDPIYGDEYICCVSTAQTCESPNSCINLNQCSIPANSGSCIGPGIICCQTEYDCYSQGGYCLPIGWCETPAPQAWVCGSGATCCLDGGSGGPGSSTPVDTIVRVTGFITDDSGAPISDSSISGNITGENGLCQASKTSSNGLFKINITCSLIPNNKYTAYVSIGSIELDTIDFYA
ncbi:MAG: hypothetical protein ABIA76_05240 [Candidatus Diapherotrites archaeon]